MEISGKLKWTIAKKMSRNLSSPIVVSDGNEEKILFVCENRTLCLITRFGKIENKWTLASSYTGSPYILGDHLYLAYDEGGLEAFQIGAKSDSH